MNVITDENRKTLEQFKNKIGHILTLFEKDCLNKQYVESLLMTINTFNQICKINDITLINKGAFNKSPINKHIVDVNETYNIDVIKFNRSNNNFIKDIDSENENENEIGIDKSIWETTNPDLQFYKTTGGKKIHQNYVNYYNSLLI